VVKLPSCAEHVSHPWWGLAAAMVLASSSLPVMAGVKIADAHAAGVLDAHTAAAYQLLERRNPDAVPGMFQETLEPLRCATHLAVAANDLLSSASPAAGKVLLEALQRPRLAHSTLSPSGHFRVHYDTEGREAVEAVDVNLNGIPDYVDATADIADSMWALEIDSLGYRAPPSDGDAGGGSETDIYILDLGRTQNYGITYPTSSGSTGPSYIEVDNDFTNPIYGSTFACPGNPGTRELDALRVTLAHEFFHVIQFGYYQGVDGRWWQEASATWMEDVAYPALDDYLQYVCTFLLVPRRSLDSGLPGAGDLHPYGASVFAHFLDQRYERDVVRWIWEENGERLNSSLDNFHRAILNVDEDGLDGAYADMGVWSYFTGERHQPGFFSEGEKYPENYIVPFPVAAKTAIADSGRIDHMATAYVRFDPRLLPGGVTIETQLARGRWARQLVLVSDAGVEVRDVDDVGSIVLPGWNAYEDVALVISNVDFIGLGLNYKVTVEYDPDLSDAPSPDRLALLPSYPNPFRPAADQNAQIPFELNHTSPVTRLSIYAVDGTVVRLFDLGARSARRYSQRWDGTNDEGVLVSSGVYHYVLEAAGQVRRGSLALIRD
jgi:hypothetical protein